MNTNIRPETMERITTPALAEAFIAQQVSQIRNQVGNKRYCWRCPAVWTPPLLQPC